MERHTRKKESKTTLKEIRKVATHIDGLDEILYGGFPEGRTTLIGGGPGTGKSVLGLEFLYHGAVSGNPGIFLTFEESGEDIRQNALTLGWDLAPLEQTGEFFLMEGQVDPNVLISGVFNLNGLLAIIEGKVKEMGAERIVIDALDILMRFFDDPKQRQNGIFVLNQWLKERKMTSVLTTKNIKDKDSYDYDYLDYMADCVIYLDQRVRKQVNTKRLQVVKYRGSSYGGNEYPFLIADDGIHFNTIKDMEMHCKSEFQRISSGIPFLDEFLGGGYQTGRCILISGATGTGKTYTVCAFMCSACSEGQKVFYINFEEDRDGLIAGMLSLGVDIRPAIKDSMLLFMSVMPESRGIEEHLFHIITAIQRFKPQHLVVDAMSAINRIAGDSAAFDFLIRLVNFCKIQGITVILTNQSMGFLEHHELTGIGVSSIIDTIITLHYEDSTNEVNRRLLVRKSRGSKHSNKYHSYFFTDSGIRFDTMRLEGNLTTD